MALTIENIATELFRMNVGEWRIAKIETHKNCYLFGLKKKGKQSQYQVHQFNLERNAFSDGFYEMWCWGKDGKPIRTFVDKSEVATKEMFLKNLETIVELYDKK